MRTDPAAAARIAQLERDLAEAVERQTATSQILELIGRSASDLQPLFEIVVRRAVRLCGADAGLVYVLDEDAYRVAFAIGGSQAYRDYVSSIPIVNGPGTLVGRVGRERRTVQIFDVLADPDYEMHTARDLGGFRTIFGVPMLAGGRVVGVITLWRHDVAPFDDRTIELVTTFAAQGAIAIQNAQLVLALQERERALERAGRHKSEFLASMSHELRTPLNAVIGFSDVLLERLVGELNERQEGYVLDIRDSGRHLLELINDILDLSKVEAGRMELAPGDADVPELIRDGLALVREQAARRGLAVSLDVAPDVGTIVGDRLRIRQVVVNLITNAVKFTPDGGAVAIAVEVAGDVLRVTVADTGIGIPEAEHERIFEAFQRGDRAVRTGTEGTGLGLTLSRRIVELHGGRLTLASAPGAGSTFTVELPVRRPAPAPANEDAGGGTILVVDGDPGSLAPRLEEAGIRIAAVSRVDEHGREEVLDALARLDAPERPPA